MYYIGIDVSKKVLSVYDGKGYLEFKNDKGLKPLLSHLKRHFTQLDDLGIIFEATGIYSDNLKEFCSRHRIKA